MLKKVKRPTNEELIELRKTHTCEEIAEMYGVNRRTITKWSKKAGYKSETRRRKLPPKEEFIELYMNCEASKIAEMYDVSIDYVIVRASQYGIRKKYNLNVPSDEELKNLCQQHTLAQIAKMYNVTRAGVLYWVKRAGITDYKITKNIRPSSEELDELYNKYNSKQIAEMFGVSRPVVDRWRKEAGVLSQKQRKRPSDEELREMFKEYSGEKIAKKLGVASSTVSTWRKELGLGVRTFPNRKSPNRDAVAPSGKILFSLAQKYTDKEIADLYNVSEKVIMEWRLRVGIRRCKRLYSTDYNQLSEYAKKRLEMYDEYYLQLKMKQHEENDKENL